MSETRCCCNLSATPFPRSPTVRIARWRCCSWAPWTRRCWRWSKCTTTSCPNRITCASVSPNRTSRGRRTTAASVRSNERSSSCNSGRRLSSGCGEQSGDHNWSVGWWGRWMRPRRSNEERHTDTHTQKSVTNIASAEPTAKRRRHPRPRHCIATRSRWAENKTIFRYSMQCIYTTTTKLDKLWGNYRRPNKSHTHTFFYRI